MLLYDIIIMAGLKPEFLQGPQIHTLLKLSRSQYDRTWLRSNPSVYTLLLDTLGHLWPLEALMLSSVQCG